MELPALASWAWIPIVVGAAFMQTIRNAAQRSLVTDLGTLAATLVRFLYGLPFALLWLLLVIVFSGAGAMAWPDLSPTYLAWLGGGAISQLAATALLLLAMKQRNFIVGVTFSKTEVLQVGLFGVVALQELPTVAAAIAMVVATLGVVLLSLPRAPGAALANWRGNAAWFGLASGACFALASVGYRGAALQWPGVSAWLVGALGVLLAQLLQTVLLGGWLWLRQPGIMAAIGRAWRLSTVAGAMGAMASIGWMTATALRPAVDVRTLGLVEVLFSYLVSRRLFREKISRKELAGLLLVGAGVLVISAQW
ncbi:MAG: EamA/RhaT family transporter [Rhodoferax sp.]|nr:EamA/RhaT family transporter [Rhodoferax sp.]MCW5642882.1 EamA/RhaT family transporter [Rhodoferax sp.]